MLKSCLNCLSDRIRYSLSKLFELNKRQLFKIGFNCMINILENVLLLQDMFGSRSRCTSASSSDSSSFSGVGGGGTSVSGGGGGGSATSVSGSDNGGSGSGSAVVVVGDGEQEMLDRTLKKIIEVK